MSIKATGRVHLWCSFSELIYPKIRWILRFIFPFAVRVEKFQEILYSHFCEPRKRPFSISFGVWSDVHTHKTATSQRIINSNRANCAHIHSTHTICGYLRQKKYWKNENKNEILQSRTWMRAQHRYAHTYEHRKCTQTTMDDMWRITFLERLFTLDDILSPPPPLPLPLCWGYMDAWAHSMGYSKKGRDKALHVRRVVWRLSHRYLCHTLKSAGKKPWKLWASQLDATTHE